MVLLNFALQALVESRPTFYSSATPPSYKPKFNFEPSLEQQIFELFQMKQTIFSGPLQTVTVTVFEGTGLAIALILMEKV